MSNETARKGNTLADTKKAPTGLQKGQQERKRAEGTQQYSFVANAELSAQLDAIINQRRKGKADTLRLLIYKGLEVYNNNRMAGITTRQQAQQEAAAQRAKAQATQQAKKQRQRDTLPAATAILIDDAQSGGD